MTDVSCMRTQQYNRSHVHDIPERGGVDEPLGAVPMLRSCIRTMEGRVVPLVLLQVLVESYLT